MAYKITDECVNCGACESECPVGAISEGDSHYEIDGGACLDCVVLNSQSRHSLPR